MDDPSTVSWHKTKTNVLVRLTNFLTIYIRLHCSFIGGTLLDVERYWQCQPLFATPELLGNNILCIFQSVLYLFSAASIFGLCILAMGYIDTSALYHIIRAQSVIKLYVIYNMLEVKCYMDDLHITSNHLLQVMDPVLPILCPFSSGEPVILTCTVAVITAPVFE